MLRGRFWLTIGAAALALATCASAARKPGDPLKPGFNLFSKADDIQVGQENAKQVLAQYEVVKNPYLQDYVRRLGEKLAAAPEAKQSGFTFTFTVLNVDEINAFALPGGPMFIYTGLLKAIDNEAQLAGVMGHEMSHVILRHGTHEATKANGVQILAGGLAGLLGGGKIVEAGLGLTASSFVLKFSRDAESEADALGSHLMAESGYDPVQMAKFFEKLAGAGQRMPQILSDHPNPGNREAAIVAEMRTLPVRKYGFETTQFARVKKEVAALPPPVKKPDANAVGPGSSVPPSSGPASSGPSGWQQYRGKTFTLAYPPGWQTFGGDDNAAEITFAPNDGLVTRNGKTQIGFGVIAGASTGTLDALIRKLKADNPQITVTSATPARIAGADGKLTTLKEDSPFGGAEIDGLFTLSRSGRLYYLICIAPETDYSRVQASFQQIADSIRFP
jgi:Zn-dependent protease with chaperone function